MPRKRATRSTPASRGSRAGAGRAVLAFLLGVGAAAAGGYLYLHSTSRTPAPSTPTPLPASRAQPPQPLLPRARPVAPFGTSEDVFEAGARLYSGRCASCHGTPKGDIATTPPASQFWRGDRHPVAAQAPGDLYNEIARGALGKGMPAYEAALTDTQIWQLALLLKHADEDLPDPVIDILNHRPGSTGASR